MKTFNHLFLFTFIILLNNSIYAQIDKECGFKYTPKMQHYYDSIKEDIKVLEREFMENKLSARGSSVTSSVPIKAHIVRNSNGLNGLTVTQLNSAIATMNSFYINAGLEFFLCEGINYIDNDDYFDFEKSEEDALTTANMSGVINIYFVNSITNDSGNGLCGYAYYPGGPETILMDNSCTLNGSTLSHEMGHFFSLRHTHGSSGDPGSTEELVDGSNCETTGDNICDTPADPRLSSSNVNFNCVYTGTTQDANGDFYQPNPLNIMSYARKICRTEFSPQQYARINATYQVTRSSMTCPSFSADFTADQTESCLNNLTVNFTDNSVGATSWSWDVNGDDVIDYTTQNFTHTYTDNGNYDVALTISNGSTTISKVKTEYIEVGYQEISTSTITLTLILDNYPAETSWQFIDSNGTVLYSSPTYTEGIDDFTMKTETFAINNNECYSFIINDSQGDGICCGEYGDGSYELKDENNTILASGGDFDSQAKENFRSNSLNVNKFNLDNISLFPNPTSSSITIKSAILPDTYIIYNALGQTLKKSTIVNENDLNINVEDFNDGMYFIKLSKGDSNQVLSFVKK